MAQSPIVKTLDDLLAQLKEATKTFREAEESVTGLTAAIRALAQVCEDEEIRTNYLNALEELSGKPGFLDAVRSVLKGPGQRKALTAAEIKEFIVLGGRMSLSGYSNPMASIHTTLRRMKDKSLPEIEEVLNDKNEKAYRLIPRAPVPPRPRTVRF
jgi:hypothetical protein